MTPVSMWSAGCRVDKASEAIFFPSLHRPEMNSRKQPMRFAGPWLRLRVGDVICPGDPLKLDDAISDLALDPELAHLQVLHAAGPFTIQGPLARAGVALQTEGNRGMHFFNHCLAA